MIFMPDRRGLGFIAALLLLAAPGWADTPADFFAKGRADLSRGDGIAAEADLSRALAAGTPKNAVAPYMGEAYLDQGDRKRARAWLGSGDFAADHALHGLRMLGFLERQDGNLPAAGRVYDRALAIAPNNLDLWVDIGRLRYAGGEQAQAIEAIDHALSLDPYSVRAMEFRGQLLRDQFGLAAALPWFEKALALAPNRMPLLGEYAATLGELGRAKDMLVVTRHMLSLDGNNAEAFYLQAVMAARAGDTALARAMLGRTRGRLSDVPAVMLLESILELRAGNAATAAISLERLISLQPANARAQLLLARALAETGENRQLLDRYAGIAGRTDTSPYLLTLLGRAQEELGRRDLAASVLDRAANSGRPPIALVAELIPDGAEPAIIAVRRAIAANNLEQAAQVAEQLRTAHPGAAYAQAVAGDAQYALGKGPEALERYRAAAQIRLSDSLLLRMMAAMDRAGAAREAWPLVTAYAAQNPGSRVAAWTVAVGAAGDHDWARCQTILEALRQSGAGSEVHLLADLSVCQWRNGNVAEAVATAQTAYHLQRSSAAAAQAYGVSLAVEGKDPALARAMLDKARTVGGDNPQLAAARARLKVR